MPKKSNEELVRDLKEIESRVQNLLIDLKEKRGYERSNIRVFESRILSHQLLMPKKSNKELVRDLKEIESRVQNLLIDLKEKRG